ncbi:hypothetical protein P8S53_12400 [Roseinatronobacter sp. S2]|nr:hypothetical protein P8S53_12400 [Roseinatronobacter sp. S2]
MDLLTHCISFVINALYEKPNPYSGGGISQHGLEARLSQADRLARATGLDMVAVGWKPTVGNYLGRVTKPRNLEGVRDGAGERAAELIGHLKKGDMAKEAERLLAARAAAHARWWRRSLGRVGHRGRIRRTARFPNGRWRGKRSGRRRRRVAAHGRCWMILWRGGFGRPVPTFHFRNAPGPCGRAFSLGGDAELASR